MKVSKLFSSPYFINRVGINNCWRQQMLVLQGVSIIVYGLFNEVVELIKKMLKVILAVTFSFSRRLFTIHQLINNQILK